MMKPFAIFALALTLLLAGCGKGKTTDTASSKFTTLAEKREFLERYVKFRRNYDDLHFHLTWNDGGGGMVPSPTEWNVRVLAVVPAAEIDLWIDGLSVASDPELHWIPDIPQAPSDLSGFEWYTGPGVTIGIDRKNRTVLYWNRAT